MPSKERKKRVNRRVKNQVASQNYRMRHPDTYLASQKRWKEKNRESRKTWDKKNSEKVKCHRKAWETKNPGMAKLQRKLWDLEHPLQRSLRKRRWKLKHKVEVSAEKQRHRQRWLSQIQSKYRKWYQKNAQIKRKYRIRKYRANLEQEIRLRKQRYRVDVLIEKQYYQSRSVAMIKAGAAAAEGKFVRIVAKNLWKKLKKSIAVCMYEAKILVAQGMSARRKCVMRLKKSILRLQKQCQEFLKKAEEAGKECLGEICGNAVHCKSREPYFHDAAYTTLGSDVILGKEPPDDDKHVTKMWPCNALGTCRLPKECLNRLLGICRKITEMKNFRRYVSQGADQCKHLKHPKKALTIGPQDVTTAEYAVAVEDKLGHSIACFPDNCDSDMLFLRQMAVHYASVHTLLSSVYEVQMLDKQLHGIDAALIKGDVDGLELINELWSKQGTDVAPDAITIEENEESVEIKLRTLSYAVEFLKDIHEKPVYGCAECHVLHYKSQVRHVTFVPDEETGTVKIYTGTSLKRKDAEKKCNDLWLQLYGAVEAEQRDKDKIYVCHKCFSHLTNGATAGAKHSSKSIFNKLDVADTPPEVADLNDFENHFIKKAKCFQVIFRLGTVQSKLPASCRVKAHKGAVVHFPLPVSETLSTLPDPQSMPSDQNLFIVVYGVPTKNKMVWKALVDVGKIRNAIEKLKQINPEYRNLTGTNSWDPLDTVEMTEDKCDEEVVRQCELFAQKPMVRKIDEEEEARITESYTVQPLFRKRADAAGLDLYQMERVEAERIDPREQKLDLWCFPHLYPDGKNGEGEQRESRLSPADFIDSRLYNENPKFRHDHQYLFYLLHKYQLRAIANSISQTLRNTFSYNDIPVGEFVRRVAAGDQELDANLYTAFRKIRGTAEYWDEQRRDLRTMIRELGPPTWFLTFSAAEYSEEWQDMRDVLIEVNKCVKNINEMTNGERCAMDPVFTSKHFHHRFRALMNKVLLNKEGPLGEVADFFWRVEYQARGAPHFHMVVWVKNAPRIGIDPPEKVLEFIQKYATCRLPDKNKAPLLHKLVTDFQTHRCSKYCRKIRGRCRFGFPRDVMEFACLNDPLKSVGQRLKGKSKSRLYYLPRAASERCINDYNAELLLLWQANMDLQFVGENTQAVVNYIVNYVTKKERSTLQDVFESLQKDKSVYSRLFNIACRSLATRECGAYEAVDLLTGQRLFQKSRSVRYINSRQAHLRPRMLKPLAVLKEMNPESTDKYECSWISTYYPDRPDSMEDMCLYDFMRLHDRDSCSNEGPLAFKTPSNGRLKARNKPYLISHAMFSFQEKPEEYCYSLLLLFKPFRNETDELLDPATRSCIAIFQRELICNQQLSDYHSRLVLRDEEDAKNKEAIERERTRKSLEGQRTPLDAEPQVIGEPAEVAVQAMQEFQAAMRCDDGGNLEDNVSSLNPEQKRIFHTITNQLGNGTEPLRLFISGAGGTGKSYLINTLKLWMQEQYGDKNGVTVAIAAYTGLAAFNVNGVTLHNLLQLPVQHGLKTAYTMLTDSARDTLRKFMKLVKVFVIDEVSMVSNVMLAYIHMRLNEIFNTGPEHVPFGNMHIIVMGDLTQLQPVGDGPPFQKLTAHQANKIIGGWGAPDLWNCFSYDEMTINMRQKEDPEFASILERLRFGQLTEQDASALQTRLVPVPPNNKPLDVFGQQYLELRNQGHEVLCLMPLQNMVSDFNNHILALEPSPVIEIPAIDSFEYQGRRASKQQAEKGKELLKKKAEKQDNRETAGIDETLRLCIGARVMLRKNVNVAGGLVNGATGRVTGFQYLPGGKVVEGVHVKFDNVPGQTTVLRRNVKFELFQQLYVTRSQFALILAYAMTIHKSQGKTASQVMVDVGNHVFKGKGEAGAGMSYVALSRSKCQAGLHILNFDPSLAFANSKCIAEINRLRALYTPHLPQIPTTRNRLKKVMDRPWSESVQKVLQPDVTRDDSDEPPTKRKAKGKAAAKRKTPSKSDDATAPKRKKVDKAGPDVAPKRQPVTRMKRQAKGKSVHFATVEIVHSAEAVPNTEVSSGNSGIVVANQLKPPGFCNPRGVVCYSNAAMQALMSLDTFRQVCMNLQNAGMEPFQHELVSFLHRYEAEEVKVNSAVLSTEKLRTTLSVSRVFQFGDRDGQQCAGEFMQAVMQKAEITGMFMVRTKDKFRCEEPRCGHEWLSRVIDTTPHLSVLPWENHTIDEMISSFRPDPDMPCQRCRRKGKVMRAYEIVSLPDQFIMRVHRYHSGRVDLGRVKDFDADSVAISGQSYRAVAAIEHLGVNMNSGHYTVYVRRGNTWWHCNDGEVTKEKDGIPNGMKTISFLVLERRPPPPQPISVSIL